MSEEPLDLDMHRGMAAQRATVIRRILAEVENNARSLRDRQGILESQLLAVPAASWPEAAAALKSHVLNANPKFAVQCQSASRFDFRPANGCC
jgi:hypothetical protein